MTDIKNRVFTVNGEHQNARGIPRVYCIDRGHIDSHTRTPDSMKCGSHHPSRCASISLRPLWRTSECDACLKSHPFYSAVAKLGTKKFMPQNQPGHILQRKICDNVTLKEVVQKFSAFMDTMKMETV